MRKKIHRVIGWRMMDKPEPTEYLSYVTIYESGVDVPLEDIAWLVSCIKSGAKSLRFSSLSSVTTALANLRWQEEEKVAKRDAERKEAVNKFVEIFLQGISFRFRSGVAGEYKAEIMDQIKETAKMYGLGNEVDSVVEKASQRFDELFPPGPAAA